ncbi:MAG: hypothetical protein AVDCRST_MAG67-1251, partial [uncultured Solirubrobacteraceae bacterium]
GSLSPARTRPAARRARRGARRRARDRPAERGRSARPDRLAARPRAVSVELRRAAGSAGTRHRPRGRDPREARGGPAGRAQRRRGGARFDRAAPQPPARPRPAPARAPDAVARATRHAAARALHGRAAGHRHGGPALRRLRTAAGDRRLPQAHPGPGRADPRHGAGSTSRCAVAAARADEARDAAAHRSRGRAPPPRRARDDRRRPAGAARATGAGASSASSAAARHARGPAPRRALADAAARAARAGAESGRAGRAVGNSVADRAVRVRRPEPAAELRGRVGLLSVHAGDLARPRRLRAARLPRPEGRAGPPRGAAVERRPRRAQLGLRLARRDHL